MSSSGFPVSFLANEIAAEPHCWRRSLYCGMNFRVYPDATLAFRRSLTQWPRYKGLGAIVPSRDRNAL